MNYVCLAVLLVLMWALLMLLIMTIPKHKTRGEMEKPVPPPKKPPRTKPPSKKWCPKKCCPKN